MDTTVPSGTSEISLKQAPLNEAPVANRLAARTSEHRSSSRNSSKMDSSRAAWYRLKRSQQIAVLVFVLRYKPRGQELNEHARNRLAYLQEISSLEAITRGFELAARALTDLRLQGTLVKAWPFAKSEFRLSRSAKKRRKNRIRGYRDKGTLSDESVVARRKADQDAFIKIGHFKDDKGDSLLGVVEFLGGILGIDIRVGKTKKKGKAFRIKHKGIFRKGNFRSG